MLCPTCVVGKPCKHPPVGPNGRRIVCPICDGEDPEGCTGCNGTGKFSITECGKKIAAESGFYTFLRAYNDYERHGLLPMDGGTQSQTLEFMAACRQLDADLDWIDRDQASRD